ncbi:MAG: FAD-binding protein [Propionibacteriaceae bacterium]|nr:FAD-binding protein [Propionibacteriaceae bacterium]
MTRALIAGLDVEVVAADVIVVGTGAAGWCAADRLVMLGVRPLIITDHINAGTSRNAGSDKQTYYKMTLAGADPDSVRQMADTLYAGGAMDGDLALAEAAWSTRAFFHLVEAGVRFPHNEYGESVGYTTDHDRGRRATSAGPHTSTSMVERLQARVIAAGVPVIDQMMIVDLIQDSGRIRGLLCWQIDAARFRVFRCDHVVYATGGPGGIYADSVYPHGQWGAHGAALRAGVRGKNLTEWQYGLASVRPRWNVSGSYMQAIPRFVSTDAEGRDEREFLSDAITDPNLLASLIFLKGYQWPFDQRATSPGSSVIDLLVHRETVHLGRRVFLDFRADITGYDPERLSREARTYLAGASALDAPTPVERLRALNEPAYRLYREKNPGLDLGRDLLEVAVCAQHNNGGLACDLWWESSIRGLHPVGEAAGTHGVYRPGGAALNSGQVGALRAAMKIRRDLDEAGRTPAADRDPRGRDDLRGRDDPSDPSNPRGRDAEQAFLELVEPVLAEAHTLLRSAQAAYRSTGEDSTSAAVAQAMRAMSDDAGVIRARDSVAHALCQVRRRLVDGEPLAAADPGSRQSLARVFRLREILTTQYVVLSAMEDYLDHGGRSRGSALYLDPRGESPVLPDGKLVPGLEDYRFLANEGALDEQIQEVVWDGRQAPVFSWRPRRPIPRDEVPFEVAWKAYRDSWAPTI